MDSHCLPVEELPQISKLYSAFLSDFARVESFYAHPAKWEGVRAAAKEARVSEDVRRSMAELLRGQNERFGAGADVAKNLDRLAAGAVTVVTGQQVGLFGGPAYSFYKALTAVAVARELTGAGVDAVPVFWLAAEDHDCAEVDHCFWWGGGELHRLGLERKEEAIAPSVGRVAFGPAIDALVQRAVDLLEGESVDWISRALQESYTPRDTFSTAFGRLMTLLLAGRGLIVLDPMDPALHRLAAPVYSRAITERETLTAALLARDKALAKAGFHSQVKVTERSTLLFLHLDGNRVPLRKKNGDLGAGKSTFTAEELGVIAESSPERFSANVLLRPVVQDSILPTAAYVGGPAETAYFAQAQVAYQRLLGRMPAVVPRAGFTLVDAHAQKLLKRYALSFGDVISGRSGLRRKMELASLPRGLNRQFEGGEKALRQLLRKLRSPLGKLDRSLEGALDTAEHKMLYQFLKLRGKAGRSENLRSGVLDRHERALLDSLYPNRGLQERMHSLLPWLARTGPELLDEIENRITVPGQHQVLFL